MAELLTQRYFGLAPDEWRRNSYGIFTRGEVDKTLHQSDVFAHVVRYGKKSPSSAERSKDCGYGIVLQDPNILLALLRSPGHDLWTLGLFILTHELTHIVRFRKFEVDFFAPAAERDTEEELVHGITREILRGVTNTDYLLGLYGSGLPKVE